MMTKKEQLEYGKEISAILDRHGVTMEQFKAVATEIREVDKKYGVGIYKSETDEL